MTKQHKSQEEEGQAVEPQIVDDQIVESEDQKELEKKLSESEAKSLEYKNMYLRALADYKNLEHRMNLERDRMKSSMQRQYVERFLPVLDNMEQAETFMKDPGLQMVISSFRNVLKDMGVREVELLGEEYDPYKAEVVEVVAGEKDNIIVEVLQRAYELNGEVIRHGTVKVSKIAQ